MTNISNMFLSITNAGDLELVPRAFTILLKWQYRKIGPLLVVNIYHF